MKTRHTERGSPQENEHGRLSGKLRADMPQQPDRLRRRQGAGPDRAATRAQPPGEPPQRARVTPTGDGGDRCLRALKVAPGHPATTLRPTTSLEPVHPIAETGNTAGISWPPRRKSLLASAQSNTRRAPDHVRLRHSRAARYHAAELSGVNLRGRFDLRFVPFRGDPGDDRPSCVFRP
jgi:hypothetical protein